MKKINELKSNLFKKAESLSVFLSFFFSSQRRRYSSIFCFSLFISVLIFYFMSVLISSGKASYDKNRSEININFLLNESIDQLELRSRRRPEKPKEREPPPESPKLKVKQTEIQKPEMLSSLPPLQLPDHLQSGEEGGIGVSGAANRNREVTPIFRVNPIYPRQAALRNIEGFVILQFDIKKNGETDNISILQASPPQMFNSSAVQALKRWKYKPKLEDGRPVRQNHLKVQLDFNLINE